MMKTKNFLVSVVLALFLVATFSVVSAAEITSDAVVTVDGIEVYDTPVTSNIASVVAGEEITVKVYFTADEDDTDVYVTAELEGEKVDVKAVSSVFDVESGKSYKKTLSLIVPYELKDEISDDLELNIEIDGKEHKTELDTITLRVQRPSYNVEVKSITVPSNIGAGDTFPVEIVLSNIGYNDLDDVYVTAKISELGVSQGPKWFDDLVNLENCSDDCDYDDTVMGRLYLDIPYNAKAGVYSLEVVVKNDDLETVVSKQILVKEDFADSIISTSMTKTVARNEEAEYELLIVNPTDNVKVYKILTDSQDVTSTPSQAAIAIPAGSSKTVLVKASSDVEGEHTFNVNVFSGTTLEKTVGYKLIVEGKSINTLFVLTIVLAVIFLVLLVALIILLGKKPEKNEDLGESYY